MGFLKKTVQLPTKEQLQEIAENLTTQEAAILLQLLKDKDAKKLAFDYLFSNIQNS